MSLIKRNWLLIVFLVSVALVLLAGKAQGQGSDVRPDWNFGRVVCDNMNWPRHHFIVNCQPRWRQWATLKILPPIVLTEAIEHTTGLSETESAGVAMVVANAGHVFALLNSKQVERTNLGDLTFDLALSSLPLLWSTQDTLRGKILITIPALAVAALNASRASP
jgi:hypothetical protein